MRRGVGSLENSSKSYAVMTTTMKGLQKSTGCSNKNIRIKRHSPQSLCSIYLLYTVHTAFDRLCPAPDNPFLQIASSCCEDVLEEQSSNHKGVCLQRSLANDPDPPERSSGLKSVL
jgi:hypothetical protein